MVVRADGEILFRRDATAPPPEAGSGQRRFQFAGVPTIAVSDERLLPPGSHTLQVNILSGGTRIGLPQEVTSDFKASDRRTLSIQLLGTPQRAAGQRGATRFTANLE